MKDVHVLVISYLDSTAKELIKVLEMFYVNEVMTTLLK